MDYEYLNELLYMLNIYFDSAADNLRMIQLASDEVSIETTVNAISTVIQSIDTGVAKLGAYIESRMKEEAEKDEQQAKTGQGNGAGTHAGCCNPCSE